MQDSQKTFYDIQVAPARERGLKCSAYAQSLDSWRRSREGAWIEITKFDMYWPTFAFRRSREGAWIEIGHHQETNQNTKCRSREGAWIEIALSANYNIGEGGRSREGAWIEIYNHGNDYK